MRDRAPGLGIGTKTQSRILFVVSFRAKSFSHTWAVLPKQWPLYLDTTDCLPMV
jgi:hypothetical protein